MRTELTAVLAGTPVRGTMPATVWDELLAPGTDWHRFLGELEAGDPRRVRAVLRAALKAAGDLKPLDVLAEVDRLMEAAGVAACQDFAVRLVSDAIGKAETALGNSPAAAATATAPAAAADTSPT